MVQESRRVTILTSKNFLPHGVRGNLACLRADSEAGSCRRRAAFYRDLFGALSPKVQMLDCLEGPDTPGLRNQVPTASLSPKSVTQGIWTPWLT